MEHLTKSMHKNVPNSEVIWYDSVTINGELKWQNQLNDLNSPYFDVCDGIFLNYTWNEEGLASSVLFDLGMSTSVMTVVEFHSVAYDKRLGILLLKNPCLEMIEIDNINCRICSPY